MERTMSGLPADLREWCDCEADEMCTHCAGAAEIESLDAENERLRASIRDIDAHATPMGLLHDDDPEGSPAYYYVTVGALHRALAATGTAAKCADLPCPRSAWLMESATAMRAAIERVANYVTTGRDSEPSFVDFLSDVMQSAAAFDVVVRDWQVNP